MVCDAGNMKLYQFLVRMLEDTKNKKIIAWTDRGRGQFRLVNPEKVSSINLNLT